MDTGTVKKLIRDVQKKLQRSSDIQPGGSHAFTVRRAVKKHCAEA